MYKAWGGVEKFSHATLVKSNALACVQGRAKGETYNYFDELRTQSMSITGTYQNLTEYEDIYADLDQTYLHKEHNIIWA